MNKIKIIEDISAMNDEDRKKYLYECLLEEYEKIQKINFILCLIIGILFLYIFLS